MYVLEKKMSGKVCYIKKKIKNQKEDKKLFKQP